jgi:hypothetical protein
MIVQTSTIYDKINTILYQWNPLGLPIDIALYEYKPYIPEIMRSMRDRQMLIGCLERIITDDMDTGYDKMNMSHKADVVDVANKIMALEI